MKNAKSFPFEKARPISPKEVARARRAIEKATGLPRPARGRPVKPPDEKYLPTSIRLHPKALTWVKQEARRRGVGYQTVINEILLCMAGQSPTGNPRRGSIHG
jgi:uncharacterized protein (DUF4415 family)